MTQELNNPVEKLLSRIDERLARPVRPLVYVEIVDPSGRVSYRRWSDHPDVQEALGTQGYTVRRCPQQPDLEGEAHPDRALLVEARAQLAAQAEALGHAQDMLGLLDDGDLTVSRYITVQGKDKLRHAIGGLREGLETLGAQS